MPDVYWAGFELPTLCDHPSLSRRLAKNFLSFLAAAALASLARRPVPIHPRFLPIPFSCQRRRARLHRSAALPPQRPRFARSASSVARSAGSGWCVAACLTRWKIAACLLPAVCAALFLMPGQLFRPAPPGPAAFFNSVGKCIILSRRPAPDARD